MLKILGQKYARQPSQMGWTWPTGLTKSYRVVMTLKTWICFVFFDKSVFWCTAHNGDFDLDIFSIDCHSIPPSVLTEMLHLAPLLITWDSSIVSEVLAKRSPTASSTSIPST